MLAHACGGTSSPNSRALGGETGSFESRARERVSDIAFVIVHVRIQVRDPQDHPVKAARVVVAPVEFVLTDEYVESVHEAIRVRRKNGELVSKFASGATDQNGYAVLEYKSSVDYRTTLFKQSKWVDSPGEFPFPAWIRVDAEAGGTVIRELPQPTRARYLKRKGAKDEYDLLAEAEFVLGVSLNSALNRQGSSSSGGGEGTMDAERRVRESREQK